MLHGRAGEEMDGFYLVPLSDEEKKGDHEEKMRDQETHVYFSFGMLTPNIFHL